MSQNIEMKWKKGGREGREILSWDATNRRAFEVHIQPGEEREKFSLFEAKPFSTGAYLEDGHLVTSGPVAEQIAHLREVSPGPGYFYDNLPDGIEPEDLMRHTGGYGTGTIYYESMQEVESVVREVMEKDVWYQSHSDRLSDQRRKLESEKNSSLHELQESLAFWSKVLHDLTFVSPDVSHELRSVSPIKNQVAPEVWQDLVYFLENPTDESWDKIARANLLLGQRTGWKIWRANDPSAPITTNSDGKWTSIPNAANFKKWTENSLSRMSECTRVLVDHVEQKINRAENGRDSEGVEPSM